MTPEYDPLRKANDLADKLRPKCVNNSLIVGLMACLALSLWAAGDDEEKARDIVKDLLLALWRDNINKDATDEVIETPITKEEAIDALTLTQTLWDECTNQPSAVIITAGLTLAVGAVQVLMDNGEIPEDDGLGLLLYLLQNITNYRSRLKESQHTAETEREIKRAMDRIKQRKKERAELIREARTKAER